MLSYHTALAVLACVGTAFAAPSRTREDETTTSWAKFSSILDTIDENVLHRVLHAAYPKYQDGVFSKDRTAVEQVHLENPLMASRLLHIAKRQTETSTSVGNNITSTTISSSSNTVSTTISTTSEQPPPPPPTSTTTPSTTPDQTTQAPPPPPTSPTTTQSQADAISSILSSALSNQITATSVPPPTTVFVIPSTPASATPIRTESQGVIFSSSGGLVTLTSSPVNVRFTPVTKTNTFYTTLTDGVHTRTSIIIVNAPVTEPVTTPTAGLRDNGAGKLSNGVAGLMIGALGVIAAI